MAKLDTISFARLVSYVQGLTRFEFGTIHLETMLDLTDKPEPQQALGNFINTENVKTGREIHESIQKMARSLAAGRKIEAIKEYRSLTGTYLKEAKDAIELFPTKTAEYVQIPSYRDNY